MDLTEDEKHPAFISYLKSLNNNNASEHIKFKKEMKILWNSPGYFEKHMIPLFNFIKKYTGNNYNNLISNSCIVDLGSGKGQAIYMFHLNHSFKKIKGIELDEEYYNISLNNFKYAYKNIPSNVEIINLNAEDYIFEKDDNFVFLFNPFGADTLSIVMKNIYTSLKNYPRDFFIIYNNDIHNDVIMKDNKFEILFTLYKFKLYKFII